MNENILIDDELKNKSGIYLIYDESNNVYVGQTSNFERRYSEHKSSHNKEVKNMIKNNAKMKILELENTNVNLSEREQYWITYYFLNKDFHCVNKELPSYCNNIIKYGLSKIPISKEVWTPICNYKMEYFSTKSFDLTGIKDNKYEVSNFGKIRDIENNEILSSKTSKRSESYILEKSNGKKQAFNITHLMLFNFYYDRIKELGKSIHITRYSTKLYDSEFYLCHKMTNLEDANRILSKLKNNLLISQTELKELQEKILELENLIKEQEEYVNSLEESENNND